MKKIAFTIVLNGMPFIKKQAEIIPYVFDEWHIIEGASLPHNDTSWCSTIDKKFYSNDYLSLDGTTEFIDSIVDNKKIFVYRKGDLYNGKTEMCNEISYIMKDCILMQFDVDEIWSVDTLREVISYTENTNGFDGMLFKCNYYVGPNLITVTDNAYGNNIGEWCRLWKISNHTSWKTHEPPRISGLTNFLSKAFTYEKGWVFDHYAYVLEEQVKFKENFYGYKNALEQWKKLQICDNYPCYLRDYLPWVIDNSIVSKI